MSILAYVSPEDLELVAGALAGVAMKGMKADRPDLAQSPEYLSDVFKKLAVRMRADGRVELKFIPVQQRQGVAA